MDGAEDHYYQVSQNESIIETLINYIPSLHLMVPLTFDNSLDGA